MHTINSPYESLNAVHTRSGVSPGLVKPEIINVTPNLPAEIPGYGLPRLEERPRRFHDQAEEEEREDRRNVRALVGGVAIALMLVVGDYVAELRYDEQQPERPPAAVENGYHYDPVTGEYYYYDD